MIYINMISILLSSTALYMAVSNANARRKLNDEIENSKRIERLTRKINLDIAKFPENTKLLIVVYGGLPMGIELGNKTICRVLEPADKNYYGIFELGNSAYIQYLKEWGY